MINTVVKLAIPINVTKDLHMDCVSTRRLQPLTAGDSSSLLSTGAVAVGYFMSPKLFYLPRNILVFIDRLPCARAITQRMI